MTGKSPSPNRNAPESGYEAAKAAATAPTQEERRAIAAKSGVPPEILYFLAGDMAQAVRREIASNPETPLKADLILSKDDDPDVRADLVTKTVERIPSDDEDDPPLLDRVILDILLHLASDPLPAIRKLLMSAVKSSRHLPAKVARRLAMDDHGAVAAGMVEHSPVLTDDDLLAVLDADAPPGVASALARRASLSARVAGRVVAKGDTNAIGALLANRSAQIREETLDAILEQAPDHPDWHRPLVYRPALTGSNMRKLSQFVAASLIEAMQARPDIDSETAQALSEALRTRLQTETHPLDRGPPLDLVAPIDAPDPQTGPDPEAVRNAAVKETTTRHVQGRLGADEIDEAIFAGDRMFVAAALSVLSGAKIRAVEAVFDARSAKGIVALCWKAELPMRLAIKVQTHIAHIQPQAILHAHAGTDYPMSQQDLRRHLDFFGIR